MGFFLYGEGFGQQCSKANRIREAMYQPGVCMATFACGWKKFPEKTARVTSILLIYMGK